MDYRLWIYTAEMHINKIVARQKKLKLRKKYYLSKVSSRILDVLMEH